MPSNLTRKELRDYYAAEAMNGLVAGMPERFVKNARDFAQRAFDIADAMLEESDRRGVQQKKASDSNHFVAPRK